MHRMNAPLFDAVRKYARQKHLSFHMPVHGGGSALPPDVAGALGSFDVTELDATDNLACPDGCILEAHRAAAGAFGCEFAHYMVGGSTSSIQAMLLATCRRGDTLIVDRCAHASVINACVMYGIMPVFAERDTLDDFDVAAPVSPGSIARAAAENPHAKAVLITTPTYYGICSDVAAIARLTHDAGMLLLADCAHGSHFAFCDSFPQPPVRQGADLCAMSLHKTLGALTQTSVLLGSGNRFDKARLKAAINMVQTSSPSYMMLCVADFIRADLAERGNALLSLAAVRSEAVASAIQAQTLCRCLPRQGGMHDPLRLVINFSAYGISGYEAARILRESHRMEVEMSDRHNIVCIVGPYATQGELQSLQEAVIAIALALDKPCLQRAASLPLPVIEMRMNPAGAFCADSELLPVGQCRGRISAANIAAFPPGVPVIVCGCEITAESLDYLTAFTADGGRVSGMSQTDRIAVVKA